MDPQDLSRAVGTGGNPSGAPLPRADQLHRGFSPVSIRPARPELQPCFRGLGSREGSLIPINQSRHADQPPRSSWLPLQSFPLWAEAGRATLRTLSILLPSPIALCLASSSLAAFVPSVSFTDELHSPFKSRVQAQPGGRRGSKTSTGTVREGCPSGLG